VNGAVNEGERVCERGNGRGDKGISEEANESHDAVWQNEEWEADEEGE